MKRFCGDLGDPRQEYDITQGKPGSRVVYFTANQNAEAEVIRIVLRPASATESAEI